MDELREKRYRDKISFIIENFEDLKREPQNSLEKKGIFYSLQTIIESTIDLIGMLIKDMGIPVKNDKENIVRVVQERKLDVSLGEKLILANGMRNIIVHRYNGIEEKIIFDSIEEISDLILKWMEVFEGIIDEFKNEN